VNQAVFLDRDGTIVQNVPYNTDPEKVRLIPGAANALRRLKEHDFKLIVVTNQSLVGRGMGTKEDVEAVNDRMVELLQAEGVELDAIEVCYDSPHEPTPHRKPNPGMLLDAARALNIALNKSFMIGDDPRDLEAGRAARCRQSFLIQPDPTNTHPDTVRDLNAAANRILGMK